MTQEQQQILRELLADLRKGSEDLYMILGNNAAAKYAQILSQVLDNDKSLRSSAQEPEPEELDPEDALWEADENCNHEIFYTPGSGMKCRKCPGWFCY